MSLSHKLIKHDQEGLFWAFLLKTIERAQNEYETIKPIELQILAKFLDIPPYGSCNHIIDKHLVTVKAPESIDSDYVQITDWKPVVNKAYEDWLMNYGGIRELDAWIGPDFFESLIESTIYDRRQLTNTRDWTWEDFEKAPIKKYTDSKFNWEQHIMLSEKVVAQAIIADMVTIVNGRKSDFSFIRYEEDFTYILVGYIAYHLGVLTFKNSIEEDTRLEKHKKFVARVQYVESIPNPKKALLRYKSIFDD